MKRRYGYQLQRIANTDYLLPFGQLIADHMRGISLNSVGVYIWELLEKEMSRKELHSEYLNRFMDEPDQKDSLIQDLDQFLDMLINLGIIENDIHTPPHVDSKPCTCLGIGGLVLKMHCPDELINASFLKHFRIDPKPADQTVSVIWGESGVDVNGTVLLKDPELEVYERRADYLLIFPTLSQINEVHISKDGSSVFFYCKAPFTDALGEQFFHALRHVFLYLAGRRGMYAIHSASIRYQDKAWLFSASAGTGKSTHTNLWKKLFGTEFINGDLNLLAFEDGRPVVRGIPWCGTSEIFTKETVPLGGIVLLKRGAADKVVELSDDKKALLVMQRFISPMWTAVQLKESAEFAEGLSRKISVCQLFCTKNDSAAEVMKSWIDSQK